MSYHFSFFAACKRKRTVKLDVLPFFVVLVGRFY